jgi:hypothetical protein
MSYRPEWHRYGAKQLASSTRFAGPRMACGGKLDVAQKLIRASMAVSDATMPAIGACLGRFTLISQNNNLTGIERGRNLIKPIRKHFKDFMHAAPIAVIHQPTSTSSVIAIVKDRLQ